MPGEGEPRDGLHRPMRDLRISVMDKCNFRCPYCMPSHTFHDGYRFLDADERLNFDEIVRVARVACDLGVRKLRLTGGEPLLRPHLADLVARLAAIDGIEDLALTTNGVLLADHARALRDAGLHRVTISLDSVDEAVFARMSGGRGQLAGVLRGIEAAQALDLPVKINAVIQRGVNDAGAVDLAGRFRGTGVTVRFIEYMDVGNRNAWRAPDMVPSAELHERIAARWPLRAMVPTHRGEVARRFAYADGLGEIGFISSVSQPFCGDCTRARLSSDGKLYTCLFAQTGTDLRAVLRGESDDTALRASLRRIWEGRHDRYSEERGLGGAVRDKVEMFHIGG